MHVEAAMGVLHRRPMSRAVQLSYDVYFSCGEGGLRCDVLYRKCPLDFQYPVHSCSGRRGWRSEREGGRGGGGGRAAAYTPQQLSALHFISQIIKDDYRLPF